MSLSTRQAGFTLLEIILVIVISGILGGVIIQVVGDITAGYARQSARQELVGTARAALERIAREIRGAVPGSVKVKSSSSEKRITFIPAVEGGRYAKGTLPGAQAEIEGLSDDSLNGLNNLQLMVTNPKGTTSLYSGSNCRSSVNNWDVGGSGNFQSRTVSLNSNIVKECLSRPNFEKAPRRVFISNRVITYWANSNGNKIFREAANSFNINPKNPSFGSPSNHPVLVGSVKYADTTFNFQQKDSGKNLVTIKLVLSKDDTRVPDPVAISIQEEVHIRNGY